MVVKIKKQSIWFLLPSSVTLVIIGAEGGSRTRTGASPQDFESSTLIF